MGATGSGKSSLVKLLLRLYPLNRGRILLDGIAIDQLQLGDLRRAIALVSQDIYLFHGSVGDNIAYGAPDATASPFAKRHVRLKPSFIEALPQGSTRCGGTRTAPLRWPTSAHRSGQSDPQRCTSAGAR